MTAQARSLLVVTMETPFPANHGGRLDCFNRWSAMAREGWRIQLATWLFPHEFGEEARIRAGLAPIFDKAHLLLHAHGVSGVVQRLARLPRAPTHIGARDVPADAFEMIIQEARKISVGGVVADGLFGSHLARAAAARLAKPLIYRAHNRESLYLGLQAKAAKKLAARAGLWLSTVGLAAYERGVHAEAAWTFDTSFADMEWWRSQGYERSSWSPPLQLAARQIDNEPTHDFVYLGNLSAPNNLAGLRWFMNEVLPRLRAARPGVRILFAGSKPDARLKAEIARNREIELIANPDSAVEVRARARVLINPVRSGSGTNVKSVEMLMTDKPIVTNIISVQGFPRELQSTFRIARDAEDFARHCLEALADPTIDLAERRAARAHFREGGIRDLSDRLADLIGASRVSPPPPQNS